MPKIPLIISHRGDRKRGIENTIHACELALSNGATALEIDIRETGCGRLVVFHDFSLKRMFKRSGYIGRVTLKELQSIPYANNTSDSEQYIETLDSFLEHFKDRIPINLDAKTVHFFDFKFAERIIDTLKNHQLFNTVWVSCFNPFLLQILKLKSSDIRTGYLFQRLPFVHTAYDLLTSTDAWHPHFRLINNRLLKAGQNRRKELYVWTANRQAELEKMAGFDLDGIITDNVAAVRDAYGCKS